MRRGVTFTFCSILLPTAVLLAPGDTKPGLVDQFRLPVSVVRLFSAAEIDYFHTNSRYASLAELIKSKQLAQTAMASPEYLPAFKGVNLQSDSEPVAGYVLGLIVGSDGRTFKLSLTQKSDKCGLGVFTDEKAILYEGSAINCVSEADSPSLPDLDDPEAKSIPPPTASESCNLPELLDGAASRVRELSDNLQQFSARERIDHIEAGKNGKLHTTTGIFDYVAAIHQEEPEHTYIEEFRLSTDRSEALPNTMADTGTAGFALIFHPRHSDEFAMQCQGSTTVNGRLAWQVRFAQRLDRVNDFHSFRVNGILYHAKLKGRAWIAADSYEIMRLETELMEPIKEINLADEHMIVDYAPVDFPKHHLQLWLPESSVLTISYHGRRYERRHRFSDFQLFSVQTEEKVRQPPAAQGVLLKTN